MTGPAVGLTTELDQQGCGVHWSLGVALPLLLPSRMRCEDLPKVNEMS